MSAIFSDCTKHKWAINPPTPIIKKIHNVNWIINAHPAEKLHTSKINSRSLLEKEIGKKENIILIENAKGADLYSIIKNADKVIAFHGMITSFAWIEEQPVLDLYLCEINKWDDYRKIRNSFYEFKPSYKNYDFIIPKKDFKKTINKMKFFLKK